MTYPVPPTEGSTGHLSHSGDLHRILNSIEAMTVGDLLTVVTTSPPDVEATDKSAFEPAREIAEHIVGAGGEASVSFASIPQGFRNIYIEATARSDVAAAVTAVDMRFNDDNLGNYDSTILRGTGSAVEHITSVGSTELRDAFIITGATAPAGNAGRVGMRVSDYARTVWRKTLSAQCGYVRGESSGLIRMDLVTGHWRSTSAITKVTFLSRNGVFVEDSVFTLYGEGTA